MVILVHCLLMLHNFVFFCASENPLISAYFSKWLTQEAIEFTISIRLLSRPHISVSVLFTLSNKLLLLIFILVGWINMWLFALGIVSCQVRHPQIHPTSFTCLCSWDFPLFNSRLRWAGSADVNPSSLIWV